MTIKKGIEKVSLIIWINVPELVISMSQFRSTLFRMAVTLTNSSLFLFTNSSLFLFTYSLEVIL